jgi:hypothetical protein
LNRFKYSQRESGRCHPDAVSARRQEWDVVVSLIVGRNLAHFGGGFARHRYVGPHYEPTSLVFNCPCNATRGLSLGSRGRDEKAQKKSNPKQCNASFRHLLVGQSVSGVAYYY